MLARGDGLPVRQGHRRDHPPLRVCGPMTTALALPPRTTPATRTPRLALGVVVLWVGVLVVLPLAARVALCAPRGRRGFVRAVTAPGALAALGTTLLLAAAVALVSAVFGTLLAWVLARDTFVGKRVVDALIDLPFALPTIVASIRPARPL